MMSLEMDPTDVIKKKDRNAYTVRIEHKTVLEIVPYM